jgi:hypothetical protein
MGRTLLGSEGEGRVNRTGILTWIEERGERRTRRGDKGEGCGERITLDELNEVQ